MPADALGTCAHRNGACDRRWVRELPASDLDTASLPGNDRVGPQGRRL